MSELITRVVSYVCTLVGKVVQLKSKMYATLPVAHYADAL
jgi:hypothetical protein